MAFGFKSKKKKDKFQEVNPLLDSGDVSEEDVAKKDIHEISEYADLIAPDGVDPFNMSFLVLNDHGRDVFIRTFYVSKLPTNAEFAVSFARLLNTSDSVASVFVNPMGAKKAQNSLNRDVVGIETETLQANKRGDSNRARKLMARLSNINGWAARVENSFSKLNEVAFLISIYADEKSDLDKKTSDLFYAVEKTSIELSNCYGYQYEAYLANQPSNNIIQYVSTKITDKLPKGLDFHRMDQEAVATIFNHTSSELFHDDGIYVGFNLDDGSPVIHHLYNKTHKGYGMIVAGTTGGGKSLTLKLLISRYLQDEFRFVLLDSDSTGRRGEFSSITRKFNGVNYYLAPDSHEILNIFEIDEEMAYDETTGQEWRTLDIKSKIIDAKHIVMAIVNKHDNVALFGTHAFTIETLIGDTIQDLYMQIGLKDGDAESLYEQGDEGFLGSGKKKKKLPVLSDFFSKIIYYKTVERDKSKLPAYTMLIDAIKPYIREKIICHECAKDTFTNDEFETMETLGDDGVRYRKCSCGGHVERVIGTQPYFDGQSTINIEYDTRIVNIDISQLHENEKPVAQTIALSYIKEKFIKKNAANPDKAKGLGVVFDELAKTFKYESARQVVAEVYRIARKRFVAPITATQSIADYIMHEDTKAIIKNASTQLILAHMPQDTEVLEDLVELKPTQARAVVTFDVGEAYLIDNRKAVHMKIDYFPHVEAKYLETDIKKLKMLRQAEIKESLSA